MTHTTIAHEKETNLQIDDFLDWFFNLEEISPQKRKDFAEYLLHAKTIDEKAENFIQETIRSINDKKQKKSYEIEKKYHLYHELNQNEKCHPLAKTISNRALEEFDTVVDQFTKIAQQMSNNAENHEDVIAKDTIDNIKNNLQ